MKILAIRGQNLASLSGEPFAIELDSGLLGGAGLFAISGPTGSGKSTLLDALCLPLFDCTPRTEGRGGPSVGRADQDKDDRLRASDARGILSRGAAAGFAEVDFRGNDGRDYRARWEVRRARKSASGRLQSTIHSLHLLPDRSLVAGGKKTEVLAAVQQRLGLTFEQFRRSALLAQGDFASFLHATPDDRASLLERMTGTERFTEISRQAYERYNAERAALDELVARRDLAGGLLPDQRAQLQAELLTTEAQLRVAREQVQAAQAVVDWHARASKLQEAVTERVSAQATRALALEQAAPRAELLAQVLAAEPLRLPLHERATAARQVDEARAKVFAAKDTLRQAEDGEQALQAIAAQALQALADAKARREQAQPALDAAAALDVQLKGAIEREQALQTRLQQAQEQLDAARLAHGQAQAAHKEATQRRDKAQAWLDERPYLPGLHAAWPVVEPALRQLASSRLPALSSAAATAEQQRANTDAQVAKAHTALQEAEQLLQQQGAAVSDLAAALPAGRSEALAQQVDARESSLKAAEAAERLAKDAATLHQSLTAQRERALTQASVAAEHLAQQQTLDASLQALAPRVDEASRALELANAAASLEERRHALVDGEPCPLCGSGAHPYATGEQEPPHLAAQRERVKALQAEQLAASKQRDQHQQQAARAAEQGEQAAALATELQAKLAALLAPWAAARAALPELPQDPAVDAATAAVSRCEAELAQARAARDAHARQEQALRDAQAQQTALQARAKAAGDEHERAKAQQTAAAKAADAAQAALREHQLAQEGARQRISEVLAAHPTVLHKLLDAPASALDSYQREVDALPRGDKAIEQATREAQAALSAQDAALLGTQQRQEALRQATEERDTQRAALDALRIQRAELLQGATVADARRVLDGAVTTAEQAETQARARRDAARLAHERAKTALDGLQAGLHQSVAAQERAETALRAALANTAFNAEQAAALLQHEPSWVQAEREALESLRREVHSATQRVHDATTELSAHVAEPPALDAATAALALTDATTTAQTAVDALADKRAQLKADDLAAQTTADLNQALAAQEAVAKRWKDLNALIGSADGKRLRTFAQSLTLEQLLFHANHHLRDFAGRYRLERVPGTDLDLQVIDQDMSDEIRPVTSLSGGETFLVSLALALGLSSLAASDTPVESLFIDEGFGSLDRESLRRALEALEALQASGRQVGLISHVDGLAEQIGFGVRVEPRGGGHSRVVVG